LVLTVEFGDASRNAETGAVGNFEAPDGYDGRCRGDWRGEGESKRSGSRPRGARETEERERGIQILYMFMCYWCFQLVLTCTFIYIYMYVFVCIYGCVVGEEKKGRRGSI
jgi:hypothetical protein